jgi:hypothetical protein
MTFVGRWRGPDDIDISVLLLGSCGSPWKHTHDWADKCEHESQKPKTSELQRRHALENVQLTVLLSGPRTTTSVRSLRGLHAAASLRPWWWEPNRRDYEQWYC